MNYIVSEIKKEYGGAVLLEKAIIKKDRTPALLAAVCKNSGEKETELLREMGEWFHNRVVSTLVSGSYLRPGNMMESFVGNEKVSKWLKLAEAGEMSFAFCIAEEALMIGENVYILQQQFGKPVAVPASVYGGGVILLADDAVVLLEDGHADVHKDRDNIECLIVADTESRLERAVREVTDGTSLTSLICIKSY
jgi:hypothetical protein